MVWSNLYDQSNKPTLKDINDFVSCNLFGKLCSQLETSYCISPMIEYSKCSMQKGWNIKYKKSGKSLCTIYPMKDYIIVLVVIGEKERMEAELVLTTCSEYIQQLYQNTSFSCSGKWMMIDVRETTVLEDVLKLIQTRVKPKKLK